MIVAINLFYHLYIILFTKFEWLLSGCNNIRELNFIFLTNTLKTIIMKYKFANFECDGWKVRFDIPLSMFQRSPSLPSGPSISTYKKVS